MSTVHVAHAHRVRGNRWADDPATIAEMKCKAPEAVTDGFDLIAQEMLKGVGDGVTHIRSATLIYTP